MECLPTRKKQLTAWLETLPFLTVRTLLPMAGDASFRRYYRVTTDQGSFVAMDAPPTHEKCDAYLAIARLLRSKGLEAPELLAIDLEQGFLLLTDYGDITYLKALNPANAADLYRQALSELAVLQDCRPPEDFSLATHPDWMLQEWQLHKDWVLDQWLRLDHEAFPTLDRCYDVLLDEIKTQPIVFVHRDYHSGNLMVLPNRTGILDFQDAVMGPVTYDVVSLLRDCYIDWPHEQVKEWALFYLSLLQQRGLLMTVSSELFLRWLDWAGIQRHLKAIMIFVRKYLRDQDDRYLKHIPRTLNYLTHVTPFYPELRSLAAYLQDSMVPAISRELSLCVA